MTSGPSNLENLARAKQLHAEAPDEREIAKLLVSARNSLTDARRSVLSASSRFSLAYQGAHSLALAALRSAGYRPSGSGHRQLLFQVLEFTAGAPGQLALALTQYHHRRNKVEYEATEPSALESDDLVKLASELEALVTKRVRARRS
jgi:hypothetical protein